MCPFFLVPLEPPEWIDVEVYLKNTLKIYVKWLAIPSHRVEGKLLGYKVYYRVNGDDEIPSVTVGPDVHVTTIDIANVPAPYEIRVAGFTRGGIGPISWPRERLGKTLKKLHPAFSEFWGEEFNRKACSIDIKLVILF